MTKEQKNEVIGLLKEKFGQYNNFYITDTESLTVEQVGSLRRHCFNKQVEMKVAKNTLIKKALEGIDAERYAGVYDALNNVTALMFSENPKEPALILADFRKNNPGDKPVLKAAFINGDVFVGDNQLKALTQIKTKNELIGDVIGLLQSPAKRVIAALLNAAENGATPNPSKGGESEAAPVAEAPVAEAAPVAEVPAAEAEVAPVVETVAPETDAATVAEAEVPVAEVVTANATPEKVDDLKIVEGIGPKIEEVLNAGGIYTFAQLADASFDSVKEILANAGSKYTMHDPTTWGKQAELARDGKMDELKAWQDELNGGK